jgi:hypothetical protein
MKRLAAVLLPLGGRSDSLASDPAVAGEGELAAGVGSDAGGTGDAAGNLSGLAAVAVVAGPAEVTVQITSPAPITTTTARRPTKRVLAPDRSGARRWPTS